MLALKRLEPSFQFLVSFRLYVQPVNVPLTSSGLARRHKVE